MAFPKKPAAPPRPGKNFAPKPPQAPGGLPGLGLPPLGQGPVPPIASPKKKAFKPKKKHPFKPGGY